MIEANNNSQASTGNQNLDSNNELEFQNNEDYIQIINRIDYQKGIQILLYI